MPFSLRMVLCNLVYAALLMSGIRNDFLQKTELSHCRPEPKELFLYSVAAPDNSGTEINKELVFSDNALPNFLP